MMAGAMAWVVLVAAAIFLYRSEKQIDAARSALRVFDLQARQTTDALGELRSAQQAYVVGGQGVAFWVAKVVTTGDVVRANIAMMRQSATALLTRAALDNGAKALRQFGDSDKRALEYINSGQPLMAGDVVFTEGSQAAASATQHVEAARVAERQDADAREAAVRRQELLTLAIAGGLLAIVATLLIPAGLQTAAIGEAAMPSVRVDEPWPQPQASTITHEPGEYTRRVRLLSNETSGNGASGAADLAGTAVMTPVTADAPEPADDIADLRLNLVEIAPVEVPRSSNRPAASDPIRLTLDTTDLGPVAPPPAPGFLKAAADLATDFGRVQDMKDLTQLIARAAVLTDASGVVVWLGTGQGGDLRPVLTHGYSPQVVSRLGLVPRSASNAAAAAYRTGTLQVVPSQPFSSGAIVAPILGPGGCIGALSAEFRGAETSESVQAFAAIVAAHLANVFAAAQGDAGESRAAVG
jgi:hypothetical protein